ncbi:MAG: NAAT family transporter [Deltaproteobacteria bacterium]|nr:NAAT family transporter [Deltaproteobacteria bacterium]
MVAELIQFISTFIGVFVIVDPFAMVPLYLTLTERLSEQAVIRTRRKATLVAMGILLVFALTGLSIFNLFGITMPAFQIAGGILLLLLGISQLNAQRSRVQPEERNESMEREDISVFPLGTPLLAGPGAISTVVLYATQAGNWLSRVGLVLAIIGAMAASYAVLKGAHYLFHILGRTGLNILTRIMGLILTAIAVQFVLNGVTGALRAMGVLQ